MIKKKKNTFTMNWDKCVISTTKNIIQTFNTETENINAQTIQLYCNYHASDEMLEESSLAAISGAIGWVPVLGDLGAALIDATNTGIDVARLSKKQRKKKPEVVDLKTKRRSALKAIARDIKYGL